MDPPQIEDGGASGLDIPLDATASAPPPAKKARKRKAVAGGEKATRKKRKGRLSVLPTLPLDILYEIFAHLGPGDLLHLARTTKSFRSILMTRQSAFIWKEVLDVSVGNGSPSRPADMSEPEWTALVFGRPWCTACGSRTSSAVIWMLRVRLCTKCMKEQLRITHPMYSSIPHRDPTLRLHEILPNDAVNYPSCSGRSKRLEMVIPVKDYESYKNALKDLRERYPDDSLFREQRKLLDESMASAYQARREHATECSIVESTRAENRGNELSDIRRERQAEIKRRLLALDYEERDIDHWDLQRHKDVWAPRPFTDRVWTNIESAVRKCVEDVRARRIKAEMAQRRRERENLVGRAYLDFLRSIGHSATPFMPSLANTVKLPKVADAIAADVLPTDDMIVSVTNALESSGQDILDWMQRQAQQLRELLPDTWPRASGETHRDAIDPNVELASFAPEIAFKDLDLVAYIWTFPAQSRRFGSYTAGVVYGLDAIAQQKEPGRVTFKPAVQSHLAMMQILALLGLDPAQTTVPDMYRRAASELFVCENCVQDPKIFFKSWKAAITHVSGCPSRNKSKDPPTFRLASSLERRYVSAYLKANPPVGNAPENEYLHWGCCHCDFHLHLPATHHEWNTSYRMHSTGDWHSLPVIKTHLEETHGIKDGVEGVDFFWDRQRVRTVSSRGAHVPSFGLQQATEKLELVSRADS